MIYHLCVDSGLATRFWSVDIQKEFRMMKTRLIASVGCAAMLAGLASAQDAAEADTNARRLGTVTVSAQRIEENQQDVPIAVTALSTELLEDRQVADVLDLQYQVPNINLGTNTGTANAARIFLRGVGEDESRGAVDQAVGIYVDGIYIGRSVGSLFDVVDLQQIEVLRGPQGTLYGRNTIGGAIKLTSVKPQMENSGEIRATIGNNGRYDLRATGNLQIGENTAVRLTALNRERDGFHTLRPNGTFASEGRDVGVLDILALRGSLYTEFNSDWNLYVAVDNTLDRSDPVPDSVAPTNDADGDIFTIEPLPGVVCAPGPVNFRPLGCFTGYDQRSQSRGVSANLEGRLGTLTFNSITGYRQLDDKLASRIGFPYFQETDQDQFSQEFTLTSENDGPFNYVAGVYYFTEDLQLDTTFVFPFTIATDTESSAAFAQGKYDVNEKLSFTGGLRYTSETKNFAGQNLALPFSRTDSADFDNLSYSIGSDYRLNESVLGYIKYSTGFKSGGWSADAFSGTSVFLPVREEELDSFEMGAKTDLLNDTLRLNAAYFFNDYTDLQIGSTVPGLGFTRFNVEGVEIQGFELEGVWQVTDSLQLNGNLGLLDAEYTDLTLTSAGGLTNAGATPGCGGVVSVQCALALDLKNAPQYKGSIGILYTRSLQNGELILTADAGFEDQSWSLVANSPAHALTDVGTILNARIKYESDNGWSAAVWGKNLSDEHYWRSASASSFTVYASEPITYGIDVGYTF